MYITKVSIQGFRSIKECSIAFKQGKNVLIGKNSSGKSNVISAIDILFGEKHPTRRDIVESDFFISEEGRVEKIAIVARLEGDDVDESILHNQRGYWIYQIKTPLTQRPDGKVTINPDIFADMDSLTYGDIDLKDLQRKYIKNNSKEFHNLIESIKNSPFYYLAYQAEQIEDYSSYTSEFRFIFYDKMSDKYYIIANMPYKFREAFSNSAIMPAFREPYSQMRLNKYNWYGKLIKQTWDIASQDEVIINNLEKAKTELETLASPVFDELTKDINSKIKVGFEGARVNLNF